MRTCIGKIRTFGYLNTPERAEADNPMDFLVHVRKVALPLLPQLGLEPNVYFIPPIHVGSRRFVEMLFGPGVDAAVRAYRKAMEGQDPELLGALMLNVSTDRIIRRFKVADGQAVGYNETGQEVVRVPLREPTVVRPFHDERVQAYRYNVT
jgi:nitrate reductase beta subunit